MTDSVDKRLADIEGRLKALEQRLSGAKTTIAKADKPSARDFLLSTSAESDDDKTLVAGYYIEILSGKESFDYDDIEDFYNLAREAAPANRRDPPYQNVQNGFFRKIGRRQTGMKARNKWALTNLGIERVESELKRPSR